jgi:hypothetical protein
MARPSKPTSDCHFWSEVAVGTHSATQCRGVTYPADARSAARDRRGARDRGDRQGSRAPDHDRRAFVAGARLSDAWRDRRTPLRPARGASTLGLGRLHEDCTHTLSRLLSASARTGGLVDRRPAPLHVRAMRAARALPARLARAAVRLAARQGPPRARPPDDHRSRASGHSRDPASREPVRAGVDQDQGAVHARSRRGQDWTSDLVWLTRTARSSSSSTHGRRR